MREGCRSRGTGFQPVSGEPTGKMPVALAQLVMRRSSGPVSQSAGPRGLARVGKPVP
jgi:hypothetical protein